MKLNEMKYEMLEVVDDGNLSGLDAFALKIEDWQFEPFFKKGDFLLFTKQNDIEIGQLGVYLKGDRFFIKQKGTKGQRNTAFVKCQYSRRAIDSRLGVHREVLWKSAASEIIIFGLFLDFEKKSIFLFPDPQKARITPPIP